MEKKERNHNSYSELPEGEDASPVKTAKKETRKTKESREIRILKKGKSLKERSDPDRFSGDGINFKAKIIGIEHVFDARGNRMCQGALQRLKAAVKTSGDHKQRIVLNISLNGIIIKDEKSGEVLHHHPIHKISFISQDTKDSRAFGYVYGCPQTGHRFFAIKTEKAASQVVVTLRDLFLVALEIKKKEIEKTIDTQKDNSELQSKSPENVENGISNGSGVTSSSTSREDHERQGINHDLLYSNTVLLPEEIDSEEKSEINQPEPEPAIDTLLDLQSEVNNLQEGISQMDHSIAIAVSQSLGISFSEDEVSESSSSSIPTAFQFKLDKLSSLYQETLSISSRSSSTSDYNVCVAENKHEDSDTPKKDAFMAVPPTVPDACSSGVSSLSVESSSTVSEASHSNSVNDSAPVEDRYAVFLDIDSLPSIFDNPSIVTLPCEKVEFSATNKDCSEESEFEASNVKSSTPVAFAELDPLGNQPYVDKKDFFQDIKNPPKKVLKDLVGANNEVFCTVDNDATSNSQECIAFSDLKLNCHDRDDSFTPEGTSAVMGNPPKLPPKRSVVSPFPVSSELQQESGISNDSIPWETKNPFNPFLSEDYPDIPPPNSPPPPPPPRLPTKSSEFSPSMSPPPPRPPSRVNGIPTPPLPKRKVPLSTANRTWFSFDQDAASLPSASFSPEQDTGANHYAPPLPSPARKLPPSKPESPLLKSSSASNSPATLRRFYNKSPHLGNSAIVKEINMDVKTNSVSTSPRKVLSRHTSIMQEEDAFSSSVFNPFLKSNEGQNPPETIAESCSPPLPPKPTSVSRSRPSPSKKSFSTSFASSYSSSGVSVTESSNGTHSSSSLVFSSDENKIGSSSEALFTNSTDSPSDVFSQSSKETVQPQSSNGSTEENPSDLSPDSIFRRKSDPFADDFFLSLHKKSNCDTQTITKQSSSILEVSFDNLKAPI